MKVMETTKSKIQEQATVAFAKALSERVAPGQTIEVNGNTISHFRHNSSSFLIRTVSGELNIEEVLEATRDNVADYISKYFAVFNPMLEPVLVDDGEDPSPDYDSEREYFKDEREVAEMNNLIAEMDQLKIGQAA